MNYLFDPARVVIKVRINKLYFVPEWLVFVVVIMLWNGGSLDMSRMSRSCSLILSCMGLSVSPKIFFISIKHYLRGIGQFRCSTVSFVVFPQKNLTFLSLIPFRRVVVNRFSQFLLINLSRNHRLYAALLEETELRAN